MPKINILLCGGGTGGHYYPLMAIKKELYSKSDFNFSFIGAKKGIESSKINSENMAYKLIKISGLNRKVSFKSLFQNIIVGMNVIIGFFGVVLILRPTSDIFNYYSIYSILTAFAWGVTVIILKFIPSNFSTSKIQFYTLMFNVIGAFFLFVILSNDFTVNNLRDLLLMVLTGILGGTAAILFVYAYRLISLSKLASFEYFGIPSSFLLGWIFFNEAPWQQLFPGVLLIVSAGFIIIWRDSQKIKTVKANKKFY